MCPIGFLMLGSTLQDLPSDSPAACRSACRRRRARCAPAPTNERSSRAPGLSWSATRSSWPLPNHLPRRRPGPHRRLGWPSTACASFKTRLRLRQTEPGMDAAGDHADPGHPSHTAACPTAALHDLTSAGHSGRGNARTPDTGHRTADTWTLRRPHRTLDTGRLDRHAWTGARGHWSLAPDTGRRTLAEDTDRVTKARPASAPPGPPRRATVRWDAQTVFLWTAPAVPLSPWRLGGEATFQREIALALPCSCLVAPPGPSGASAHCCLGRLRVEGRAEG